MIDLRRVHVLRVLDELGTVTAAAAALHLTPSAVSQQLRQLGRELGVALLEPEGRRVRLTPAARALLGHADELATRWERARAELDRYADRHGGQLRMCGFASVFGTLLLPATARLRELDPLLEVRLLEVETADAYQRLLAGDVDVAVTLPTLGGPTATDPRFEQRPLVDEPQDLLVPADHPLAGRAEVALEEAARDGWVLSEPHSCDQYELVSAACAAAGFSPRAVHHAADWTATFELVAAGFGVCLKPRPIPVPCRLPVAQVPLREPVPRRRLLTATRRGSREQRPIALGLDALAWAAAGPPGTRPAPVRTGRSSAAVPG